MGMCLSDDAFSETLPQLPAVSKHSGVRGTLAYQLPLEPVADALKAILDGHIVLSRRIASEGRYPAVDVLASVSRVMNDIVSPEHKAAAAALRSVLATHAENEDLIAIGAYQRGTNPTIDDALARIGDVRRYLAQGLDEQVSFEDSLRELAELFPGGNDGADTEGLAQSARAPAPGTAAPADRRGSGGGGVR